MNRYDIKARERERMFFRKLRSREYTTGSGKVNVIERVNDKSIYFTTEKSENPQRISRKQIRSAITLLYYRRTLTLKNLKGFSSAILGLIRLIFIDICSVSRTARGLIRLTLAKSVRYFFAGCDRMKTDLELLRESGAEFVLMSYYHVRSRRAFIHHCRRLNLKVLLDSGAFTLYKAQLQRKAVKPIWVEEYADFVEMLQREGILYGFFNLDVVGDPAASRNNLLYLESRGLTPIPVFHPNSEWNELEQLVQEDHEIIGIGGTVFLSTKERISFFTELFHRFPDQLFHALGVGSMKLLRMFRWFSADSTTWRSGKKFKKIISTDGGQRFAPKEWTIEQCLSHNAQEYIALEG